MKAVVYQGPKDVAVTDVPDAEIERPTDVLVKVTTTNICGSDQHMVRGRTTAPEGLILGHEITGEVVTDYLRPRATRSGASGSVPATGGGTSRRPATSVTKSEEPRRRSSTSRGDAGRLTPRSRRSASTTEMHSSR